MVLCKDLYKVILSFESVDEILKCDHSNESYWAVLSCGTVYYAVQGGSNFRVCGWNRKVWPFKWKLLSITFLWYCLLCCTRWFKLSSLWIKSCDHSKESNLAALSCGTTFLAYKVVLTFASVDLSFESVDWSNPEVRPCIQIKPVDENNDNFFFLLTEWPKIVLFPAISLMLLVCFCF